MKGGNPPAGRPRRRLEGDIKMKLIEIGRNGIEWSGLGSYGALANAVMILRVPQNAEKFLTRRETAILS
jgi:hypothetical protein